MFVRGRYIGPLFQQDQGAGGGGGENTNTNTQQNQNQQQEQQKGLRDQLTEEQRKELDSQIAAARRQAETDARTKFDADAATATANAKTEADRQKQIDEGKFTEAKASLETERDTFKTQAETEKARADKAIDLLKAQLEDRIKALPPASAEHFPKDADVLDQIAWLDDPVRKQHFDSQRDKGTNLNSNPITPRPTGTATELERQQAAAKNLAQTGQYTPL